MDGNGNEPRGDKNAAPSAESTPLPALGLETPALSADEAVAAAQQQVVASSDESRGAEEEEEEDNQHGDGDGDDEQVERFYALLANIRAMRGALHNNTAGDSTSTRMMKRLRRSAEPAWRPAFRMEDFEEPRPPPPPAAAASSSCNELRKRTRGAADQDDHGHGDSSTPRPPVAVVASSSMPHAAVRFQQESDSSRD